MYLDGYKPHEIFASFKKSMREKVQQLEEQQNIHITSEVKIR